MDETQQHGTDGPDVTGRSAMVIDDQDFIRALISKMMGQLGFTRIDEASDGKTALDIIVSRPPDIVICDILMKPMDGLSFLQVLREKYPELEDVPVIFMTNDASSQTVLRAMALGANGFLVKPVSPSQLKEQIIQTFGEIA